MVATLAVSCVKFQKGAQHLPASSADAHECQNTIVSYSWLHLQRTVRSEIQ